ncbi:acyltransferase [Flavobacterium suzhouense]|uniref:Acyltransferase n=1 Tax=Flavobacterium suzhouense TaxID=1529638 RepID=A0ABW5NQ47_9FLAO
MLLIDIYNKIKYNKRADRLGPDMPFTHWKLFYAKQMICLCKSKFKFFADTAQFRPGAYAVGCSKIKIGDRVVIRPGVMLFGESESLDTSITIEDNVMMGCGVHIYINNHKFDDPDIPLIDQGYYPDEPVVLKDGCWIGANAIILPGVTVGRNSVVGAGSIVTKSIPDGVVAVGSPAKVIKKI